MSTEDLYDLRRILDCFVEVTNDRERFAKEVADLHAMRASFAADERMARKEVEVVKAKCDKLRAGQNVAYDERSRLIAFVTRCFPSYLARHPAEDESWDHDWRWIVFVDTPHGQLSWHISDSHIDMFSHLERKENNWDGHTTTEKYARLEKCTADFKKMRTDTSLDERADEIAVSALDAAVKERDELLEVLGSLVDAEKRSHWDILQVGQLGELWAAAKDVFARVKSRKEST